MSVASFEDWSGYEPDRGEELAPPITAHQYVDRGSAVAVDEELFHDRIVRFLYSTTRERLPSMFRMLTSRYVSDLMGYLNFDLPLAPHLTGNLKFLERCGVDLGECVAAPHELRTSRDIFERKIRYWDCRPTPEHTDAVVSPADSRVVVGSLRFGAPLGIKDKFFSFPELLGERRRSWLRTFEDGDFAIFRLTPDKYHYNHTPVAGRVVDIYTLGGGYHACNPSAVVELVTPYSKNRRVVTVIDTDIEGGTGVGLVAMVEVVALMIGAVEQRYSSFRYQAARPVVPGMMLRRGQPKSLFRPGSSTVVVLFERDRIRFADDILENQRRLDIHSRFSSAFRTPLVETDVNVRSLIATRRSPASTELA